MKQTNPFEDGNRHLLQFPDATLRDLARNDAAPWKYRKNAVEVLFFRKSPYIKHEDLRPFVHELEIELDGIEFEQPVSSGALVASVTTESLYSDDSPTGFTGFDEVQIMDKPRLSAKQIREAAKQLEKASVKPDPDGYIDLQALTKLQEDTPKDTDAS